MSGEDDDERERDEDIDTRSATQPEVDEPSEPSGPLGVEDRSGREEDDDCSQSSGKRGGRDDTKPDRVEDLLRAGIGRRQETSESVGLLVRRGMYKDSQAVDTKREEGLDDESRYATA